MPRKPIKTKSGATSLYIVIFATLLFTVITVGFVNLIISGLTQTVNSELSQSAYDAAMAGVEDAKIAIIQCNSTSATADCINYINASAGASPYDGCDTVSKILGRTTIEGDTSITETPSGTSASAETGQYYTCVTIKDKLPDYRSSISFTDTDSTRLVPLMSKRLNEVDSIKISWYANTDNQNLAYRDLEGNNPIFHSVTDGVSEPPSLSVSLIQTSQNFSIEDQEIDYTVGQQTDRGTIILVPRPATNHSTTHIKNSKGSGYVSVGGKTEWWENIPSGFLKSNDKSQTNTPYPVDCDPSIGAEFVCSVIIDLPDPVGGGPRNQETTMLAVSMLYGQPSTDFSVELCTGGGASCGEIYFDGAQYAIDSTGRAADVYNRVEARIETYDIYYPFPAFALQLNSAGENIDKVFWATPDFCVYSNNGSAERCRNTSGKFTSNYHLTQWSNV